MSRYCIIAGGVLGGRCLQEIYEDWKRNKRPEDDPRALAISII